ncbi:hypothetical protein BOTBODRAFT_179478 [Botryobasidium botryosum FD-172 SS1]|uniref:20S-pre-rRNA D-site endonuclease NOB1 n=1 Tax=Botryobasidium botryosum (strain FD-172 SS1) TaxID=930990 RepID=A0A067MAJ5_BOTB1|nr:hypothetical protein BOTBODRAFT_179478 [Botryobasidium botryosum FD-172 SS1]
MASSSAPPRIRTLVLDAGPLLSLAPLRGLAQKYVTTPHVVNELKDKRARDHFEQLSLTEGVEVQVRSPDALSLAKVTQFARQSGDIAVLSQPDMHVLALAYGLDQEDKELEKKKQEAAHQQPLADASSEANDGNESDILKERSTADETSSPIPAAIEESVEEDQEDEEIDPTEFQRLSLEDTPEGVEDVPTIVDGHGPSVDAAGVEPDASEPTPDDPAPAPIAPASPPTSAPSAISDPVPTQLYADPEDESDGEGEWITPSNVGLHKSRGSSSSFAAEKSKRKQKWEEPEGPIGAACMTADYAMQNVLLQMGLGLVDVGGKRISSVKTWVLRCHACFKLCKDPSKKFCPSCGNPTLLRASCTTTASSDPSVPPTIQIHLKKNFQYRNRGTVYSIPAPKPGSASGTKKAQQQPVHILREDQAEFQRGVRQEESRARKDARRIEQAERRVAEGKGWADPDWVPDMLLGKAGKREGGLPAIGPGRRNPNEVRRKKK